MAAHVGDAKPHRTRLVDTDIVRRTQQHDIPPIIASIESELTDAG
jgi:hypothetical protein